MIVLERASIHELQQEKAKLIGAALRVVRPDGGVRLLTREERFRWQLLEQSGVSADVPPIMEDVARDVFDGRKVEWTLALQTAMSLEIRRTLAREHRARAKEKGAECTGSTSIFDAYFFELDRWDVPARVFLGNQMMLSRLFMAVDLLLMGPDALGDLGRLEWDQTRLLPMREPVSTLLMDAADFIFCGEVVERTGALHLALAEALDFLADMLERFPELAGGMP